MDNLYLEIWKDKSKYSDCGFGSAYTWIYSKMETWHGGKRKLYQLAVL